MPENEFPPNMDPQLFSLSAVLIGASLANDFSVNEQYAIGNWLMLTSQYIITHASQQNLIEGRIQTPYYNQNDIDYLLVAIQKIYDELEKIKKDH